MLKSKSNVREWDESSALLICKEIFMSKKITSRVEEMITPFLTESSLRVYDVVFVKEGGSKILRLYIDKKDGYVSIGECEAVSNELSALLDKEDIIPEAYVLEVSSPGIERVLKYDRHFEEAIGQAVDVKLYSPINSKKQLTGELISGGEGKSLVLKTEEEEIEIEASKIAEVKIHFEF